ncbi:hypothetical protein MUN78_10190 [Leucobacter allii]|uniref:Phage tail protein n=1 Tax=Leucobacter allii TaxID=2932247 RepID=A0ABY4FJ70_9MICO|nr:hypothetical protein [Leucobacter allii]UOQ56073.1 hypothetical protein MUN78_10190 [Leucobacter allii]
MANTVTKDNVRIWSGMEGAVFWAPKGTPLPATPFEDLDDAFQAIGALNEDGPGEGLSVDVNKVKAWPAGQTVRTKPTATEKTFTFTALEEKPLVTKIFYGHGDVVVSGTGAEQFARYDIPDALGTVEGAMVTVFEDDGYLKVRCMELVQVSERGDVSNGTEDPAGYELTVDNIGLDYVLTTQPAFLTTTP